MCMGCYLGLLKSGVKSGTYTCPLDRSEIMNIDPYLKSLVETDILMQNLFDHMGHVVNAMHMVRDNARPRTAAERSPNSVTYQNIDTPRRVRIVGRSQRLVFPDVADTSFPPMVQSAPSSPVANVREAMEPLTEVVVAVEEDVSHTRATRFRLEDLDTDNGPITNPEIMQHIIEDLEDRENVPPSFLDQLTINHFGREVDTPPEWDDIPPAGQTPPRSDHIPPAGYTPPRNTG